MPEVTFVANDEIGTASMARVMFEATVLRRAAEGVVCDVAASWRTDAEWEDPPGVLDEVPLRYYLRQTPRQCDAFFESDDACMFLSRSPHQVFAQASSYASARAQGLVDATQVWLPPSARPRHDDPMVPVTFWSLSPNGPTGRQRKIAVHRFPEVEENYVPVVREELARMIGDGFVPGDGGRLLLWHGDAGTGKTSALRALASEWRGWCDMHYITDPETFFGESAAYMMEILLHDESDQPVTHIGGEPEPEKEKDPRAEDGRWRLLILEDTGEMMAADAKSRTGQGLSRLLNVTDGLIGQGLKILVLVTTNETLGKLHDAVQRPGRCASQLKFERFGPPLAREWLLARGDDDGGINGPLTLADLYARLADRTPVSQNGVVVGFA